MQFLGYCQEEGKNMLVYEFMHNGTLKEHLYGNISFYDRMVYCSVWFNVILNNHIFFQA